MFRDRISVDDKPARQILRCPLTLEWAKNEISNLCLISGFVGASQDPKTLSLKPEMGWIAVMVKLQD